MKAIYKVKLTPHPIIVRVQNNQEEIIFDKKHLKIQKAESIAKQLNNGMSIDFDNLN